jgi:hypothetical protein
MGGGHESAEGKATQPSSARSLFDLAGGDRHRVAHEAHAWSGDRAVTDWNTADRLRHIGALDTIAHFILAEQPYSWADAVSEYPHMQHRFELAVGAQSFRRLEAELGHLRFAELQPRIEDTPDSQILTFRALAAYVHRGGNLDLHEPPRRARKGRERGPRLMSMRVIDPEALDHIRWKLMTDPRFARSGHRR